MKIKKQLLVNSAGLLFVILFVSIWTISPALSYPVTFVDSSGKTITINKKPEKVVSIVPSVTEILFKVGAGDTVKAVTYHDSCPGEPCSRKIVGGFFSPSLKAIDTVQPDIIFLSPLHKRVMEKFGHGKCRLITLETNSIADSYNNIRLLGKIFNKEKQAGKLVDEITTQLRATHGG